MLDKIKRIFLLRIVTIASILYPISILVYFIWFHKKFEPIYGESNAFMKSMHQSDVVTNLILFFMVCILVSMFVVIAYEELAFYIKPIFSIDAKLMSRESAMQSSGNHTGFSSIGYNYNLTFKDENEVEMSFAVTPMHYAIFFEGNKGILNYKQGVVNRFISFVVTEIE